MPDKPSGGERRVPHADRCPLVLAFMFHNGSRRFAGTPMNGDCATVHAVCAMREPLTDQRMIDLVQVQLPWLESRNSTGPFD